MSDQAQLKSWSPFLFQMSALLITYLRVIWPVAWQQMFFLDMVSKQEIYKNIDVLFYTCFGFGDFQSTYFKSFLNHIFLIIFGNFRYLDPQ